jgi:hypothetical protein
MSVSNQLTLTFYLVLKSKKSALYSLGFKFQPHRIAASLPNRLHSVACGGNGSYAAYATPVRQQEHLPSDRNPRLGRGARAIAEPPAARTSDPKIAAF